MKTKLDERQELINKISALPLSDFRTVKVFVTGMDVGKTLQASSRSMNEVSKARSCR